MKVEHFGTKKPVWLHQKLHNYIFAMNMVALTGLAASESIEKKTKLRKKEHKY